MSSDWFDLVGELAGLDTSYPKPVPCLDSDLVELSDLLGPDNDSNAL